MSTPRLTISELHKSFAVPVLSGVNLKVYPGEIHALIGENGAGKSTLMNILSGILPQDQGTLRIDDLDYQPRSPRDAYHAGISLVAQELSLIDNLSIAENVCLRQLPNKNTVINRQELLTKTQELLELLGLEDNELNTLVAPLPLGHKQLIEIAKAMTIDNAVLILDEPTAALTEAQADRLHTVIRELANNGTSIIYISHRLKDVINIANTISILRDGKVVHKAKADELTIAEMIQHMSGRASQETAYEDKDNSNDEIAISVKQVTTRTLPHPVSFDCHTSEIFGIAGLAGSGQTELLDAMYGLSACISGSVAYAHGQDWKTITSPAQAVDMNIGYVAEDRKTQGIFSNQDIRFNMSLPGLRQLANKTGVINTDRITELVNKLVEKLDIKCDGTQQHIEKLSGGNQQKVLIARWLQKNTNVLLLNEPTRGVDIHTKHALHTLFRQLVTEKKTLVVVSSEIEELMTLCDRILVLSNRKPIKIFGRDEWHYNSILEAAFTEYTYKSAPVH